MPRTQQGTMPRQFRLEQQTVDDLDRIAEWLSGSSGVPHTRTDAVRYAARQTAARLAKKSGKNPGD